MHHAHIHLRILAVLALVLPAPLAGCAKQLKAEAEYAEGTDFSKYQTYRWITDDLVLIQSGSGDPAIRTLDNEKRIRAAVERGLAAKGLKKVDSEDAQLVIAFTVGTKIHYKLQGGGSSDLDLITGDSASVTRGKLTLYVFDHATQRQIWSASTKKNLEPGTDPDTVINEAVAVLLSKFPR
jgi:hypothetical protein